MSVVLVVTDEYPQEMFYLLVQPFRLPLRLWMIRRCHVSFNAQQQVQLLHEA